jgi:type VI secretion system secreted protein Hcp
MAFQAYMLVTGHKQGQFKGESTVALHKDRIPVLATTMELKSPIDPATGHASGKRQYQPVTTIKAWGAASPQGLTACATNEVLTGVKIEFFKLDAAGKEIAFQTVNLTNAALIAVKRFTGDPQAAQGLAAGSKDAAGLEQWSFTFQKIEVTDSDGKTTFMDDWTVAV